MSKIRVVGIMFALLALGIILLIVGKRHNQGDGFIIGVILPLTGDAASYGKSLQTGADQAASEINAAGGVDGHKMSLNYEDSKADPSTAVSAINKLITADQAKVVIGDMFSGTTLAIAPVAQRNKVALVSPTASAAAVPRVGNYIFTIYPADAYEGQFLAKQMPLIFPTVSRVAIVYTQSEAMIAAKDAFKRALGSNIQIVDEEGIAPGTTNLSSVVAKVAGSNPRLVCIAAMLPDTAGFLKQATQQGLKAQFMGVSTCYDPKLFDLAGNAADSLVFSAPVFDVNSQASPVSSFVAAYQKQYGKAPDVWAAYGYDVVRLVAQGMKGTAGDKEKIRANIATIQNFQGATGTTSFNPDRSVTKEVRLLRADISSRSFLPASTH